jgi:hypothetical protein
MSDINNPHDSFFKELLSQPQNARDFLRYYIPAEIAAEFDLRKLELVRDAFVDEALQEHLADLPYCVKLKRGDEALSLCCSSIKARRTSGSRFRFCATLYGCGRNCRRKARSNCRPFIRLCCITDDGVGA